MTPEQEEAVADALRRIAAAAITARSSTIGTMQKLPPHAGGELLCEVEAALSSLIVLGAVPAPRPALPQP